MHENSILNSITNEIEEDNIAICRKNYIKTITLTEGSVNSAKNNNFLLSKNSIADNIEATSPYILNNPNININIINGDYNQILYTEGRNTGDSIEIDECGYIPSYTEAYISKDDLQKDVKSNLMTHKKNNKSSNLFNLINKPLTDIKENNILQSRNQIKKPTFKDSHKLFGNKIIINSSKSPGKSKHLLNNDYKHNKLSVDLQTLNINKLIMNQPINKDLSTGNKLKKSFESKLDYKLHSSNNITSFSKGKSIDFSSMKKDLFKINPIEKLKFIKVNSVYLNGKQMTKTITRNAPEFTSDNNYSKEYNSLSRYEPIKIDNILIQDESSNIKYSKSKEKSLHNFKNFINTKNGKTQLINNCMTQSNLKSKDVKRLDSGINRKSTMTLTDNNKNNFNTGNVKLYSRSNTDVIINHTNQNNLNPDKNILKAIKKKSIVAEVNFNNSNHKISEASRKSKIILIKILDPSSINFTDLKQTTMNLRESLNKVI